MLPVMGGAPSPQPSQPKPVSCVTPELAEDLRSVNEARETMGRLAGTVKRDQPPYGPEAAEAARLYEAARHDWHEVGASVVHDLHDGLPQASPRTNQMMAAARLSQNQYGSYCTSLDASHSLLLVWGASLAVHYVNELRASYETAVRQGAQQVFESTVQQAFEMPAWPTLVAASGSL